MTLRPTRTYRWAGPVLSVGLACFMLWSAIQSLIHGTSRGAVPWWFPAILAVVLIGFAALSRKTYIRVDDSTIVFGPNFLGRRTFDRGDVARIRGSSSPLTNRTVFLRSDGSTLWSTAGLLWGRAGLQSLADHLGVPLDGAASIRSYWDFGRWT
jgi:hypothetical protein